MLQNVCSRPGIVPDEPYKHEGKSDLPGYICKDCRWLLTRRAYCWKDACSLMLLRALRSIFCCQQSSAAVRDCRRRCRSNVNSIQPCRALESTCMGKFMQIHGMKLHSKLSDQPCRALKITQGWRRGLPDAAWRTELVAGLL